MARTGDDRRRAPSLRFGRFYIPFGAKFWVGAGLFALTAFLLAIVQLPHGYGWVPNVVYIVWGAILGVIFQPLPEEKSNATHADFAVTSLVSTAQSVASSRRGLTDLLGETDAETLRTGLALVEAELQRTLGHLTTSISDWDKIEPGVTERVVAEVTKRNQLAIQLGIEEPHA